MIKTNKTQDLLNNYSEIDLEILPQKLKKNGFEYILIKRSNEVCLYAQCKGGIIRGYELFKNKIVVHKSAMIKMKTNMGLKNNTDNLKEFREVFPNDEEFGTRAWYYFSEQKALDAYENLRINSSLSS